MTKKFTTAKGTELPLLNLKGKEYLEVKYRLVWFREEHPEWSIETELLSVDENSARARAVIKDEKGRIIATSHKTEDARSFPDFMEKAETGAIGRALALIGFGTQFCGEELDEGDRIVDAPARPTLRSSAPVRPARASLPEGNGRPQLADAPLVPPGEGASSGGDLGDYRVSFGKKYFGKRIKEISRKDMESYLDWLEKKAGEKLLPPSQEVRMLKEAVEKFHGAKSADAS